VNQLNNNRAAVGMALNDIPENPDFASFMNGAPSMRSERTWTT